MSKQVFKKLEFGIRIILIWMMRKFYLVISKSGFAGFLMSLRILQKTLRYATV